MNEYGARMPLWPQDDPRLVALVDEFVDDVLTARLHAWAEVFDQHFHHERGWDDRRVAAAHRVEGEALRDTLAAALPAPWHVDLDYWETLGA